MELDALRTLVAVVRAGSFAAVARDRGVDPSSVSRQIANLETELGLRLFDRTTRRLVPTEAGRLYVERIDSPLEELAQAGIEARDAVSVPSGLLRVTASVAFGERWLMSRIARFRMRWPRVALELRLTDAVVDLPAEGIDVGVRLGAGITGSLVATKLMDTSYRVVASPDHVRRAGSPTAPEALAERDCLVFALPAYRSRWRFRALDGAVHEIEPRAALTVSNALGLRRGALDGLGIALLADWTIEDDLETGRLIDLFPDHEVSAADFDTGAWIVYPDRAYVPAKLRVFIDCLKER